MLTNIIWKRNEGEDDRLPKGNLGKISDESSDFVKGIRIKLVQKSSSTEVVLTPDESIDELLEIRGNRRGSPEDGNPLLAAPLSGGPTSCWHIF